MKEVGAYSFTYHSPSASVTGCADPSEWDSSACPHDSQAESVQLPSEEGASPTSPGEKPEGPLFQCTLCPGLEPFTTKSSEARHRRDQHEPRFKCPQPTQPELPDCVYTWSSSRTSECGQHLWKVHELEYTEIDDLLAIPPILCPPRIIEFDLPPHISPPPIERDRQSLGGPQQRPLSPPVTPSAAYNPQLGHAEPEITTTEREDSTRLEHLAATHAPSRVVSKEDFALLGGYYKIHGRYRFPVSGNPSSPPCTDAASTSTDASSFLWPIGDLEPYQPTVDPD